MPSAILPATGADVIASVLLLIPVSFAVSWVATLTMKHVSPRIGFVDKPGHRKIHHNPKPLGGGVGIFSGFSIPLLMGLVVVWVGTGRVQSQPGVGGATSVLESDGSADSVFTATEAAIAGESSAGSQYINNLQSGARQQVPLALAFLLATSALFVMGLLDDRKALGPYLKLAVQLGVTLGFLLVAETFEPGRTRILTGLGRTPSLVLTVLWITAITNAFNFLDNMDGLSAGVAAVCAAAFLVTAIAIGQWFVAATLALLLGSLLGFLCFNFSPASIFMGDAGSLVIGFVLGVLTVRTTYLPAGTEFGAGWYAVLAPVLVLAVPLYDLLVVSAIRISRGKSPFVGDTNHFSHRLVARGMSRRTAVLTIYLVTAATSVAAILLPHVTSGLLAGLIFVQTMLILGVVAMLEQHPLPSAPDPGARP